MTIDTLNQQHALPGYLALLTGPDGQPLIDIHHPHASARIALQGAQLLHWQPAGQAPVLWVSPSAVHAPGKSVRGGVPICWPWFGAGAPGLPAHGFVRTRLWQLRKTWQTDDAVGVCLGLADDASTRALWDHAFDLELTVTVSDTLTLALTTHNTGTQPFAITQALHSYFCVSHIEHTTVDGLQDTPYIDKVEQNQRKWQTGLLHIDAETDRVYEDTTADCAIDDRAGQRRVVVGKSGSRTTVVWNPWLDKSSRFADMSVGEHSQMLCVETANAANDAVHIAPNASHTLSARFRVEG